MSSEDQRVATMMSPKGFQCRESTLLQEFTTADVCVICQLRKKATCSPGGELAETRGDRGGPESLNN